MLESIHSPGDVRALPAAHVAQLAREIREFLIEKTAKNGGHLGPNLGVVELTLAIHRVFDSPRDRILWDTGHQAYVHKILTGRAGLFDGLRRRGGLAGYPSRAESEHDVIENSHASTSLSYAEGLARGIRLRGMTDRTVVAVVGDGALTGGMAWEALNNIGGAGDLPVVVVLNDNGRSYDPTVGGLARHLAALRHHHRPGSAVGEPAAATAGLPVDSRTGPHDVTSAPSGPNLFQDLGLTYLGPVDGHDIKAIEAALRSAAQLRTPVLVHCVTRKGEGYLPAEKDRNDRFHTVPEFDPSTGRLSAARAPSWTRAFEQEMVRLGEQRPDVVAVTAAMLRPTGLGTFAERFPERTFDVGIAEQHAVTSAVGLAMAGLRPVVAMYATFLCRAFDQVLMDVALHRSPVVFALDRAGVTGDDGPSHNGMWDIAMLNVVPGLRVAAPRDRRTLGRVLAEALDETEFPSVIRYPKGAVAEDIPALGSCHGLDVLRFGAVSDVLMVSAGALTGLSLQVADRLAARGLGVTVVDPVWLKPVPTGVARLAQEHQLVVTIEDGVRSGGFGSAVTEHLQSRHIRTPVTAFGLPSRYLPQGTRAEVLRDCGLTPDRIAHEVLTRPPEPVRDPVVASIGMSVR